MALFTQDGTWIVLVGLVCSAIEASAADWSFVLQNNGSLAEPKTERRVVVSADDQPRAIVQKCVPADRYSLILESGTEKVVARVAGSIVVSRFVPPGELTTTIVYSKYWANLDAPAGGSIPLRRADLVCSPLGEQRIMVRDFLLRTAEALWRLSFTIALTPRSDAGTAPLNDTGIDWCADGTMNFLPCPVDSYPGQDAQNGRDLTHNDDSDGHAGFSFTKLDADGTGLPAGATHWSCVRDNVTGLTWEVKADDGGLRDKDWTYSWYDPNSSTNGGWAGSADDGGDCFDTTRCDTSKYVADVNDQGLCGANDWRMASVDELLSIVSNDRTYPSIDEDYFPNTVSDIYWSSSPNSVYSRSDALDVFFSTGEMGTLFKSNPFYVRLVRAGP